MSNELMSLDQLIVSDSKTVSCISLAVTAFTQQQEI